MLGVVRFLPLFFEILASTIAMVFQTYRLLTTRTTSTDFFCYGTWYIRWQLGGILQEAKQEVLQKAQVVTGQREVGLGL